MSSEVFEKYAKKILIYIVKMSIFSVSVCLSIKCYDWYSAGGYYGFNLSLLDISQDALRLLLNPVSHSVLFIILYYGEKAIRYIVSFDWWYLGDPNAKK